MAERDSAASGALDAALDERVRAAMARWHIPGATVGVLANGERRLAGFGVASLETGYTVRPDTLFQIGSITKLFTATLAMLLVEEGKLALDTPVIAYLPELTLADPDAQARLTLRMLLSHSGGFYGDLFDDFGMGDDALSAYIAQMRTLPQQTPAGEVYSYSNAGFCLIGAIIERMMGIPYERAMRERIFTPLGLTRSFFFAHEAIAYPNAVGHNQTAPGADEHKVARLYRLPRAVNAAGGIISTVDDLLTFAQFHLAGGVTRDGQRLLPAETVHAMWRPQIKASNGKDYYALGWETTERGSLRQIRHGGSTNGFNVRMIVIPERQFAIAILTNSGRGAAMYDEVIRAELAAHFDLHEPNPQPIVMSPEALAAFAGVYTRQQRGRMVISATSDGLRVESTLKNLLTGEEETSPPQEMRPVSASEFVVVTPGEELDATIDFLPGDDGRPRWARVGGRLAERVN